MAAPEWLFCEGPYKPVSVNPSWLTSNVVALAQSIDDERDFERMPILADALEEAGCTNENMLKHCRLIHEHAPGCWVVDLILGRDVTDKWHDFLSDQ